MKTKYIIEGLDCPNCAAKLAKEIEKLTGVISCKINFLSEDCVIESETTPDDAAIAKVVKSFDKHLSFSRK